MNERTPRDRAPGEGTALARPMRVTVSGSFRRHMPAVYDAVLRFQEIGLRVLSPEDPRIVDAIGDFVFLASDRHRSIRLTEDRHLDAIRHSDFLWLVAPDGYVGPSASLEMGFALAFNVPILSNRLPIDDTHRHYVHVVPSLEAAARLPVSRLRDWDESSLLLDPVGGAEVAHKLVEVSKDALVSPSLSPAERQDRLAVASAALRKVMM